jgi:hypothetical protein
MSVAEGQTGPPSRSRARRSRTARASMLVASPGWPETHLDASRRPARSVRGTYADGSGGSVCGLLWLGSVGPVLALVAAAAASCELRCNTAVRGRRFDRSQRRRYNWGHNTCADEARQRIHDQRVVPALPPQYEMRIMIGRMIAPSARMISLATLTPGKNSENYVFR